MKLFTQKLHPSALASMRINKNEFTILLSTLLCRGGRAILPARCATATSRLLVKPNAFPVHCGPVLATQEG